MKMRRILLVTDQVTRAEIIMPEEGSKPVFDAFLREGAVPLLRAAVTKAATNGTGCMQIDIRVSDFEQD